MGDNVAIMLASVRAQAELYILKLGDIINLLPFSSHVEAIDGSSVYFFIQKCFV